MRKAVRLTLRGMGYTAVGLLFVVQFSFLLFALKHLTQQIQELKEYIKDSNDRILFKEKRCEAASAVNNYKLCDNLSEEIVSLKSGRCEFKAELNQSI